jgi:benzoylformate decarboxylase
MNVRDAFYELLRAHGITTFFGNPGSNELPLLKDFPDDFTYVLALHEGAAIGMADGYAQATGRPSLVNLHAAAGMGNAMGTLTNTQSGHVPVLITSGQQARKYVPLNAMLTNVDAIKLAEPLVKWSSEPLRPQDVPHVLSKGIFLAAAAPAGPIYISLPLDDWDYDADENALALLKERAVHGDPIVADGAIKLFVDALLAAKNPVMIVGPGIDDEEGWDGATRLASSFGMPVWVAPSPSRAPFPTRHPSFQGILPAGIATVSQYLDGHDLVVVFGAAIFRYHEYIDGDFLPAGAKVLAVTSDPDEATRAPFGHTIIGNPSNAAKRIADAIPSTVVAKTTIVVDHAPVPDTSGPAFTDEAILDALNAVKTDDTVIALEWTSVDAKWDRFEITRPGSVYFPASGGLGWGLPAAIGLALGDPSRRVIGLLGDGSTHYTISGLWTAARHNIPVTFVVCRNSEYAALKRLARLMLTTSVPGLDLPEMDLVSLAGSYGIPSKTVATLEELRTEVAAGLKASGPTLVEVEQRRIGDE